jgi:long-chain acyl-CoA synthetase
MTDDEVVFVADGRRVTQGEYRDRVARATALLRSLGVGPGDKIGIALRNCPEFYELMAAAGHAGARVITIAWRLKQEEVRYLVEDSGAKIVFYGPESASQMTDLPAMAMTEYERRLAETEPAADVDGAAARTDVELYSSGTTGRPKAIEVQLPKAMPEVAPGKDVMSAFLGGFGVAGPGEVHLLCGPLYHSQPMGFSRAALAAGHRVVMMRGSFDAEECLALIDREKVTWMTCVPTHFIRILALPEEVRSRYDLGSLKCVLHSAAPCPRDIKARAIELFPPDTIWEIYGGTEGAMTMIGPREWLQRPGSVGKPFAPGGEVRIMDDDGEVLPPGQPGKIYSKALYSFRYRGAAQLNDDTWRGDYFTIGDVGYLDEDGYLFITDRVKDMIISGGANIYPAEVEAVLFNHPAVGDAAVIGVPDAEFGESVKAIVEPRTETSEADIIAFCRANLAHYKCPKSVDLVPELPRDPNGKIRKRELREPYWAEAGRAV